MTRKAIEQILAALGYYPGPGTVRPTATDEEINGNPEYTNRKPVAIGSAKVEAEDLKNYGYFMIGIPVTVPGVTGVPDYILCRVCDYNTEHEDWQFEGAAPKSYRTEDQQFPQSNYQPTIKQALILFGLLDEVSKRIGVLIDPISAESIWEGDIPHGDGVMRVIKGRVRVQQFGPDKTEDGLLVVKDRTLSILKLGDNEAIIGDVQNQPVSRAI